MAAYVLVGIPFLIITFRFALIATPDGLDYRPAWARRRFVPWSEVERVDYSSAYSAFVIHAADGSVVRVAFWIPGVGQLLELLEQHLDPKSLRGAKAGYKIVGREMPKRRSG
jgi:hypothetical protein